MKNNIAYIIFLTLLTIGVGYLLPQWWLVAVVSFLVALGFRLSMLKSALLSFITVTIVWFLTAFLINADNEGILSSRIGNLFGVGSIGIMLISGILGGTIAMMAALTGASLNKAMKTSKN